jgi:hypothetical protein
MFLILIFIKKNPGCRVFLLLRLLGSARWRGRAGAIVEPQYCSTDIEAGRHRNARGGKQAQPRGLMESKAAASFYFLSQANREKSWHRLASDVMSRLFFFQGKST